MCIMKVSYEHTNTGTIHKYRGSTQIQGDMHKYREKYTNTETIHKFRVNTHKYRTLSEKNGLKWENFIKWGQILFRQYFQTRL